MSNFFVLLKKIAPVCARNGNRYKWYLSDGKHSTYLPKSKRFLAEQLALKKYLTLLLEDALHEKRALDFYLRHHSETTGKAQKLLTEIPEYQELLSSHLTPSSQDHQAWMNSPYEHNQKYPESILLPHTKQNSSHLVLKLSNP